jgi:glycosyltransferase involved in cell wall biosynthesis
LRVVCWCRQAGIPLFSHNDSNIRTERKLTPTRQFGKNLVYGWWMPRVAGVMSMGELGDQFFVKYGAKRERIYHVPCTPNYDRYAQVDPLALNAFRQKFGLQADRKYILYSGRLVQVKRVDLLIDAFAAIARSRPDWDLLIVGDGVLRDELHRRVPPELSNRILWTGFLQESECVPAYHAAEVLVLPSDVEPWALVIQEAMAAGRAVVASDAVGAAYELVEDRVSGRIFPIGDVRALEAVLLDVTEGDKYLTYQEKARAALAAWRQRVDPVTEVRRALQDVGVLPLSGQSTVSEPLARMAVANQV